jgi:hypothetical protein
MRSHAARIACNNNNSCYYYYEDDDDDDYISDKKNRGRDSRAGQHGGARKVSSSFWDGR